MKGGGVSRGSRVPLSYFEKDFFKKPFRIIPWLWKRVLHLVWALYYVYIVDEMTLNMAKLLAVRGRSCWWMSILNQLKEDLKLISWKCKVRLIFVGYSCKWPKIGVNKCLEICANMGRGGGSTPNGKNHLNFLFRLVEHLPKTSHRSEVCSVSRY